MSRVVHRRPGAGFNRRGGGRGFGGSPLLAPSAPSIAGAVTIDGTLTITPGAGGGPVASNNLYRDGVLVGTVVSGYTYVAADIGPSLTVKAVEFFMVSSSWTACFRSRPLTYNRWHSRIGPSPAMTVTVRR